MSSYSELLHEARLDKEHSGTNKRVRILIVDDSDSALEVISALLNLEELFDVVGRARNGVDALEAVALLSPELVLMDVQMPKMNGFDAARMLRRYFPETRVVLMSAENSCELRDKCRACGADAFVPKMNFREEFALALWGVGVSDSGLLRNHLGPNIG